MTQVTEQVMQALHKLQLDAIGKAAEDAVKYGAGVMIMDADMNIRHVPIKEYLQEYLHRPSSCNS
jgi:hypothetical protein